KNKKLTGVLLNGEEKIPLRKITYEDKKLSIPLQNYELSLELNQQDEKTLMGHLVRHNKNPVMKTPVAGIHGETRRFDNKKDRPTIDRSEEHTSELQSRENLVCRLLLE